MHLRSSGALALAATAFAVAVSAGIQAQQIPAPIDRGPAVLEGWPRVGADVTTLDKTGEPASGVTLQQLVITDNGKQVLNGSLTPAGDQPVSVCLVVDTSGSTVPVLPAIVAEITQLIQHLPAGDELCAVNVSGKGHLDVRLAMGRNKITTWAKSRKSYGGTALWDGVNTAALELERHARCRSRVIVLIGDSDYRDNASDISEADLLATLHQRGAPVLYTLLNINPDPLGGEGARPRTDFTRAMGGLMFQIKHPQDIPPAVTHLLHSIGGRYRLEFTPSDSTSDGKEHRIDIQPDRGLTETEDKRHDGSGIRCRTAVTGAH